MDTTLQVKNQITITEYEDGCVVIQYDTRDMEATRDLAWRLETDVARRVQKHLRRGYDKESED